MGAEEDVMQSAAGDGQELSPQQGWEDIHATMDQLRSSMYVAGTATILLVWGAIISLGFFVEYSFTTFLEDAAADRPWIRAPLWFGLVAVGMVASALIGDRAGRKTGAGGAAKSAGIRTFFFWLTIAVAAFVMPAALGLWEEGDGGATGGVSIGIAMLGFILFGIMHRPIIAVLGLVFLAAYFVPYRVAGDNALLISAVLMAITAAAGWAIIRRSDVP